MQSARKKFKTMPINTDNYTHKAPVNDKNEQMNISARFVSVFVVCNVQVYHIIRLCFLA